MGIERITRNNKENKSAFLDKQQICYSIIKHLIESSPLNSTNAIKSDHFVESIISFTLKNSINELIDFSININCINKDFIKNIEKIIHTKIESLAEESYKITRLTYNYRIFSSSDKNNYIIKSKGSIPFDH